MYIGWISYLGPSSGSHRCLDRTREFCRTRCRGSTRSREGRTATRSACGSHDHFLNFRIPKISIFRKIRSDVDHMIFFLHFRDPKMLRFQEIRKICKNNHYDSEGWVWIIAEKTVFANWLWLRLRLFILSLEAKKREIGYRRPLCRAEAVDVPVLFPDLKSLLSFIDDNEKITESGRRHTLNVAS